MDEIIYGVPLLLAMLPGAHEFVWEYARRHQSFRKDFFRSNETQFVALAKEGQAPRTLFIGCSDSRVIPELITSSKPGELFVIRTAGNFVPRYDSGESDSGVLGSIEFAVGVLRVSDIVICGHSGCGAIDGLFTGVPEEMGSLNRWLSLGAEAKALALASIPPDAPLKERNREAGQASVVYQLQHLLSHPFIKEKIDKEELNLHGWYFDIESGAISTFDPATTSFLPLL